MERSLFIKSMLGFAALGGLTSALKLKDVLAEEDYTYPVLFIGHGSPMNGIEDNAFSQQWKAQVKDLPTPKAVIVISAHWLTQGTFVTAMEIPKRFMISEASHRNCSQCNIQHPVRPKWQQPPKTSSKAQRLV